MNDEHLRQRYPDLAELVDGPEFVAIAVAFQAKDREITRIRAELERRDQAAAEALADQTLMRGLTVEDGAVNLDLIPPREIAAIWVHCAVGMLGDAPNYSETPVDMPKVSMEISPAGTVERYALIVQRVGKLTPHEARQAAEARAERAEAAVDRVLEVHRQGDSGACVHCSQNDYPDCEVPWPCPTVRALGSDLERNP